MHGDLALRHRAALSHLAALPILTSVWLPLLLRRYDPDDELLYFHSTGAALYQGITLISFTVLWFCRLLPYRFTDEVSGGFVVAFLGVVALSALSLYFLGAIYLALQAWNGEPFWAPLVGWLIGCEPPAE